MSEQPGPREPGDSGEDEPAPVPAPPEPRAPEPAGDAAGRTEAPGAGRRPAWQPTGVTWGQLLATAVAPPLLLVLVPVVVVGVLALVGEPGSVREVVDVMGAAAGAALAGAVSLDTPVGQATVGAAPMLVYALLALGLCRWSTTRGVVSAWWPALLAAAASAALWAALAGLLSVAVAGEHGMDATARPLVSAGAGAGMVGLAHLRLRSHAGRRAVRWLLLGAVALAVVLTAVVAIAAVRQAGVDGLGGAELAGLAGAAVAFVVLGVNLLVWAVFLPFGAELGAAPLAEQSGFVGLAADAPWLWAWPPVLIVLVVAFGWGLPSRAGWAGFGRRVGVAAAVAVVAVAVAELVGRVRLGIQTLPPEVWQELGAPVREGEVVDLGVAGAPGSLLPGVVALVLLAAAGSYLRSARDEPDGWARLPGVQPGPADEPAVRFVARAAREAAAAVRGQLSREIEAPRPPRHNEPAAPSAEEPPPDSSGETSPR